MFDFTVSCPFKVAFQYFVFELMDLCHVKISVDRRSLT